MLKVVFKNIDPSQMARDVLSERICPIMEKFTSLNNHQLTITVEMENSPTQAGPDLFTISTRITGKVFKNVIIKKSSENFYHAAAALADSLNESLGQQNNKRTRQSRIKANSSDGTHV